MMPTPHPLTGRLRKLLVLAALLVAQHAAAGEQLPIGDLPEQEESWYVVELLGQRAGYAHSSVRPTRYRGEPAIETREELRQEVARVNGGIVETLVVSSSSAWLEALDGRLLRLESRIDQGGGEVEVEVEVEGERARLSERGTSERRREIGWSSTILGPHAVGRAIGLLLAGEREEVAYRTFSVEAGNVPLEMRARLVETRADGSRVIAQQLGELGIDSVETYAADGTLVEQRVGPVTMRRATRAEALAPLERDLAAFERLSVGLDRSLAAPRSLARAAFRLRPREAGAPALDELFVSDARQRIERRDGEAVLVVTVPPDPERSERMLEDSDRFLAASGLIESDDPRIRRLAARVAGKATSDDLERARRLEAWVAENVRYTGSGIGLATARQTLDSKDGDCTENAFLLAALLRAARIPSRIVLGLVYSGSAGNGGRFVPHAWVEAYVHDGWLALDSALYAPRVDATHLAMAKTAGGEEGGLLDVAAPLLNGLGRFDLEWVEPAGGQEEGTAGKAQSPSPATGSRPSPGSSSSR